MVKVSSGNEGTTSGRDNEWWSTFYGPAEWAVKLADMTLPVATFSAARGRPGTRHLYSDARRGQIDPDEIGNLEFRPAKIRIREIGAFEEGTGEIGIAKDDAFQARALE